MASDDSPHSPHPWSADARKGKISRKRRSETICLDKVRTEPISAVNDKLRYTWGIHRSINYRYGGYCGGYIKGSALPTPEEDPIQGAEE